VLAAASARRRATGIRAGGARRPLAALTAFGALLRFPTLDVDSYWLDEATTLWIVGQDAGGMLQAVWEHETSPPLYYVLAWGWVRIFGTGEVGLRSLSALFGTALIPVAYWAAGKVLPRRGAWIVAAFVAVHPLLVYFSQEARSYALLALLGGISVGCFLELLRAPGRRIVIGWAVASALAMATHYFGAFLVAAEVAWLLAVGAHGSRPVLAAVGALALFAVPVLAFALHQRTAGGADWIAQYPLDDRVVLLGKKYLAGETGHQFTSTLVPLALLVAAALVLLVLHSDAGARRAVRPVAAVALLAGLAPFVLAAAGSDYVVARNFIALLLPVAIVLAGGLAASQPGAAGAVVAAALVVAWLAIDVAVALRPGLHREDWREVARQLRTEDHRSRVLAVMPARERRPLELYLGGLRPPPPGTRAAEIVLVRSTRNPGDPAPRVAGGFVRAERRLVQRLTVIRYRTRSGASEPVGDARRRLETAGAAVLFTR
jgi:mannosyltransferase